MYLPGLCVERQSKTYPPPFPDESCGIPFLKLKLYMVTVRVIGPLTVYQRMLLMDGFVIMNIDLQAYENILKQAVGDIGMTLLFVNSCGLGLPPPQDSCVTLVNILFK